MALDDISAPRLGSNSNQAHDHIINGSTGHDVIVLGTCLASIRPSAHRTATFEHDTILNFEVDPSPSVGQFDFTVLSRSSDNTVVTHLHKADIATPTASIVGTVTDGQIRPVQKHVQEGATASTTDNDPAEEVQQLFRHI